jgi:hypothetical protein
LTASNRQGGKQKGKPQQRSGVAKKLQNAGSTSSTLPVAMVNPSFASNAANLATRRLIVNGSADGSSVALDTQETHHACMAVAHSVTAAEHAFCVQVVDKPVIVEPR